MWASDTNVGAVTVAMWAVAADVRAVSAAMWDVATMWHTTVIAWAPTSRCRCHRSGGSKKTKKRAELSGDVQRMQGESGN